MYLYVALDCPLGMVYQQCGPVCPQTCDTDEDAECSNGCVEGCFCPSGKVLYNEMCINEADCEGILLNTSKFNVVLNISVCI